MIRADWNPFIFLVHSFWSLVVCIKKKSACLPEVKITYVCAVAVTQRCLENPVGWYVARYKNCKLFIIIIIIVVSALYSVLRLRGITSQGGIVDYKLPAFIYLYFVNHCLAYHAYRTSALKQQCCSQVHPLRVQDQQGILSNWIQDQVISIRVRDQVQVLNLIFFFRHNFTFRNMTIITNSQKYFIFII